MSLIFGARSIVGGITASSRYPKIMLSNLRSFQTLSSSSLADTNSGSSSNNGNYTTKSIYTPLYHNNNNNSIQLSNFSTTNKNELKQQQFRNGKPTLEYAKTLPSTFASMTNEQVLQFSEIGLVPEACRECIVRDVMVVDQIDYDEAMKVFKDIAATNREGMARAALPFYFGLSTAMIGGWASVPFVFNLTAVNWFNDKFVTAEMPPPEDLETFLEVGSASWGWMEPVLGQISFLLLCMQFARTQLQNLGIRPYFHWQRERRARYLVEKYPMYNPQFLANYSRCDRLVDPHELND